MHRLIIILAALALLFTGVQSSSAQGHSAPIYIVLTGDVHTVDPTTNELTRLTEWGYIGSIALSPDRALLVYDALPQLVVDVLLEIGGVGGGPLPNDLILRDLLTGEETRIAGQPEDAVFMSDEQEENSRVRSEPVWSPDGDQVAWTELRYPLDAGDSLIVHDIASGEQRVIVPELPIGYGVPAPTTFLWGQTGFVVRSYTYNTTTQRGETNVLIYAEDGTLLNTIAATPAEASNALMDFVLVDDDGEEKLALVYNQTGIELVDLLTGEREPLTGSLELRSATNPDESLAVTAIPGSREDSVYPFMWQLRAPDGAIIPDRINADFTPFTHVELSPDGAAAAYITSESTVPAEALLGVWRDGESTFAIVANRMFDLAWGGGRWTVSAEPIRDLAEGFTCPGAPAPRLTVGGQGIVLPGAPNNLRTQPSLAGERVGEMPAGAIFDVVDGPVCADGIVWFEVITEQVTAWTAESADGEYYLEPVE
jgi:hypothetical protein